MHADQIDRYGGTHGLRDRAGLESAIATPQATFGGVWLHDSIPAMAAAYLFHVCQNHAFLDGITFLFWWASSSALPSALSTRTA
jgi:death on curing protein